MSSNFPTNGRITPPLRRSSLYSTFKWTDTKSPKPAVALSYTKHERSRSAVSWKSRGLLREPSDSTMSRDMKVQRWDGAARNSSSWDSLRRDPELWFSDGDCYVHLYGNGQSRRGPAFKVPFEALLATNCHPLLDRFLVERNDGTPTSDCSDDSGFFGQPDNRKFDLYIPAPAAAEREQAFLYHVATRNFFAWMFGKPLVGTHLGGAIVGLLNSMNEFRTEGEDNVEAILEYLEGEVYADMRNSPDHALAVLYFAEHFRFRDMWIDAFAHCCGMNDILITSVGFDYMSRQTRALITRTRMEMDSRLETCGRQLSNFLSDEMSESYLNLSSSARDHLDHFRTWLQSYYVAKLGYYPPASPVAGTTAFPSPIYRQMRTEFQKLYNLLVDTTLSSTDSIPVARQGGVCVLQTTKAFDEQQGHKSMPYPFPLLPELSELPGPVAKRRFHWPTKVEKVKPGDRVVFAALAKATNRTEEALYDCSLVRAYRGFEKECIVSSTKGAKGDQLSPAEGRKVRWLLIYATLQTLNAATKIPEEVRDVHNVPYNLCVLTKACPPWNQRRPIETLFRSQTDQSREDYLVSFPKIEVELCDRNSEIKPDIDYSLRIHRPPPLQLKSQIQRPATSYSRPILPAPRATTINPRPTTSSSVSNRKGSVRRALSTLGSMPELHHPSPRKASFHEILVRGYGNGTLNTIITPISEPDQYFTPFEEPVNAPQPVGQIIWPEEPSRKSSVGSDDSIKEAVSSRWSESSYYSVTTVDFSEKKPPSFRQHSRNPSDSSDYSRDSDDDDIPTPNGVTDFSMPQVAEVNHDYGDCVFDFTNLDLKSHKPEDFDYYMTIKTDVSVDYEANKSEENVPAALQRRGSTVKITA